MTNGYGDIFTNYLGTNVLDTKGREIGYAVVFRDNGTDFRAYVQKTRLIKGEWQEFGVQQRSLSFKSQAAATAWAYTIAKARIAAVKKGA